MKLAKIKPEDLKRFIRSLPSSSRIFRVGSYSPAQQNLGSFATFQRQLGGAKSLRIESIPNTKQEVDQIQTISLPRLISGASSGRVLRVGEYSTRGPSQVVSKAVTSPVFGRQVIGVQRKPVVSYETRNVVSEVSKPVYGYRTRQVVEYVPQQVVRTVYCPVTRQIRERFVKQVSKPVVRKVTEPIVTYEEQPIIGSVKVGYKTKHFTEDEIAKAYGITEESLDDDSNIVEIENDGVAFRYAQPNAAPPVDLRVQAEEPPAAEIVPVELETPTEDDSSEEENGLEVTNRNVAAPAQSPILGVLVDDSGEINHIVRRPPVNVNTAHSSVVSGVGAVTARAEVPVITQDLDSSVESEEIDTAVQGHVVSDIGSRVIASNVEELPGFQPISSVFFDSLNTGKASAAGFDANAFLPSDFGTTFSSFGEPGSESNFVDEHVLGSVSLPRSQSNILVSSPFRFENPGPQFLHHDAVFRELDQSAVPVSKNTPPQEQPPVSTLSRDYNGLQLSNFGRIATRSNFRFADSDENDDSKQV